MRIRRPEPAVAFRQAAWIAAMEPWLSLGYQRPGLARYLRRMARARQVLVAEDSGNVLGVIVFQSDFLLGRFIALLAVRSEAAGRGIGRTLVLRIEQEAFKTRRWLYVSSDSANQAAARFYRKLGFSRVARLPGLIRDERTEILWRKPRPAANVRCSRARSRGFAGRGRLSV
jgi:ribosomal protein S18 acetylase RimI-like enzyme